MSPSRDRPSSEPVPRKHDGLTATVWPGPLAILAVIAFSVFLLHRELRQFRYHDITRALFMLEPHAVAAAVGLAILAYSLLPAYDALGLAYAGRSLPVRRIALGSLVSYGLSQTLGFSLATGGSVRYRFWSRWGITTLEIARAIALISATFVLGLSFTTGLAFLIEPATAGRLLGISPLVLDVVGAGLLVLCAAYVASAFAGRTLRIRGFEVRTPGGRMALAQLALAVVDWTLTASILYVLLPSHALGFPAFVALFLVAQTAGLLSHVPGGAGVFETLMVVFLTPAVSAAQALAALVAFRAIYYLLPFVVAMTTLAIYEVIRHRGPITRATTVAGAFAARWVPSMIPQALSVATFIGGVILLFSGATPGVRGRLTTLDQLLPLGVIELSHLAGSITGAALLVLAWALQRRLDAAYRLTVWMLSIGIVASLLKGLDWEEALALAVVLALLIPSRKAFYRRAALASEPLGPAWTIAVVAIASITVWLGFFSYKHVEFSTDLWFRFTTYDDAPRFLRASVASVGGLMIFGLMRLLRHAEAEPEPPGPEEMRVARSVLSQTSSTSANLVLLGDKAVMIGASERAFLMYAVEGRSWIAMGDPIGDPAEAEELVWRFREEADRHGAWTVFYEVGTNFLPLYIDLGLTLVKIGEEAIIDLASWTLEGPGRKGLRRTMSEMRRRGVTFEMLPPARVKECLGALKKVSDEWLESKRAREKGFSLGRFDEQYIENFFVAVLRDQGEIVAFANLWMSGDRTELSVDLMRHANAAPPSSIEYLLLTLFEWGRAEGFQRFNLGMAPMSGLPNRAIAPVWSRAGALLFRHGEYFYNFRGLRQYKEKFYPKWEPRYLATPGGVVFPRVLSNTAALISGGLRGVVRK